MEIRRFEFKDNGYNKLKEHPRGQNWPVVYLINDEKELYVGETTSAGSRFSQHLNSKDEERRKLKEIRFVFDEEFNKSAILDIEQTLSAPDILFKLWFELNWIHILNFAK